MGAGCGGDREEGCHGRLKPKACHVLGDASFVLSHHDRGNWHPVLTSKSTQRDVQAGSLSTSRLQVGSKVDPGSGTLPYRLQNRTAPTTAAPPLPPPAGPVGGAAPRPRRPAGRAPLQASAPPPHGPWPPTGCRHRCQRQRQGAGRRCQSPAAAAWAARHGRWTCTDATHGRSGNIKNNAGCLVYYYWLSR